MSLQESDEVEVMYLLKRNWKGIACDAGMNDWMSYTRVKIALDWERWWWW